MENFECGRFADSIGANEAEYLSGAWSGQPVEFERVGMVAVNRLLLQVRREVNDLDGLEGTFLHADTATDAQRLVNSGRLVVRSHLNSLLLNFTNKARLTCIDI